MSENGRGIFLTHTALVVYREFEDPPKKIPSHFLSAKLHTYGENFDEKEFCGNGSR